MREAGLRTVLLAQACEEADPEGAFVPNAAREAASREAAAAVGEAVDAAGQAEALLQARAERLLQRVAAEHPALAVLSRHARFAPPAAGLWLLAFALGLAADGLGRERELNLLAFPLLGLVGWNLAVYAAALAGHTVGRSRPAAAWRDVARAWQGLRARLTRRGDVPGAFLRRASTRFAVLWLERAGTLEAARWRARLHAGAAAFALGVVAGLYLAGFAFAYRATWESTFLDAGQVRALLGWLLGPASGLLGLPLPDAAALAALEAPGSGPAAPWIHRWSLTAGLLVVLPRLLLAARSAAGAAAAARRLSPDLTAPYAMRLLAAGRGEGRAHVIVPYSMEPSPAAAARLRELAHDLFGNRARVRLLPHVAYGGGVPEEAREETAPLLVFDLAQSPEREVHGAFVEALGRVGPPPLVVLDRERYESVAPPERVEERRRAWRRVLAEVGAAPIELSPVVSPDDLIEAARGALSREAASA